MNSALPYQSNLFDQPVLKIVTGKDTRDAGIKKAVEHADEAVPGWSEKGYQLLLVFLSKHNGPFMAEEVRSYAALIDFPLPPHARAWGGVIARAAKAGIITRVGYSKVKNVKAHCANAAVWKQTKNI